jgi:hypothetical protein
VLVRPQPVVARALSLLGVDQALTVQAGTGAGAGAGGYVSGSPAASRGPGPAAAAPWRIGWPGAPARALARA